MTAKDTVEIWKPIEGFSGQYRDTYEVSNLGRIRCRDTQKYIKTYVNCDNYEQIDLHGVHPKYPYVHRIVASAFCENSDPVRKTQVDHLDMNPRNNHASNLAWVSRSENLKRAAARRSMSHKTQVRCVETGEIFTNYRVAAEKTGFRQESIRSACLHKLTFKGYHWELIKDGGGNL